MFDKRLLTDLCVEALTTGDDSLRAHARALLTLVRYHDSKQGVRA